MNHVNVSLSHSSSSLPKTVYNRLRIEGRYTDVTLVSDDNKLLKAHRLVLSAGSRYFDKILEDKNHPHLMLCLDGINSDDLNNVLEYIYNGETKVPEAGLANFLKVATRLKCLEWNLSKHEENMMPTSKTQPDTTMSSTEIAYNEVNLIDMHESKIKISEDAAEHTLPTIPSYILPKDNTWESKKAPKVCKIDGKPYSLLGLKKRLEQLYQKGPTDVYYCLKCPRSRNKRSHMEDHAQGHLNGLEFTCNHCGKIFHTTSGIRRHRPKCTFIINEIKSLKPLPLFSFKTEHFIREEGDLNED